MRRISSLAIALLLLGCSGSDHDFRPSFDLVARLGGAETTRELSEITFDTDGDRKALRSGWSSNEFDRSRQRSFSWGIGSESTVLFPLVSLRELTLSLEGRSFGISEELEQRVSVTVNGHQIGETSISRRLETCTFKVPKGVLKVGSNLLRLQYSASHSPLELGISGDRRQLAVAWYSLGFASQSPVSATAASVKAPGPLEIPSGTALTYYLRLPERSELRIERWRLGGSDSSALVEVDVLEEHRPSRTIAQLRTDGSGGSFPLAASSTGPVGLRFRAIPSLQGTPNTWILDRPLIWSPIEVTVADELSLIEQGERDGRGEPRRKRPNVLIYLVDTLRADRLGCYGSERNISPNIDAFAESAILFEDGVSQSSWTKSSVASIFTGLWPADHGANRRDDRLGDDSLTLAERLHENGYRSVAFVTNPNVSATFGFGQGFDEFFYLGESIDSDEVTEKIGEWLEDYESEEPFLLYVHTLDPHAPYAPPAEHLRRVAGAVEKKTVKEAQRLLDGIQAGRVSPEARLLSDLESLYDAEISANDAGFGALLRDLRSRDLIDDAVVMFLSDHGEEFREHGNMQHGRSLHKESIHVPLILKLPGVEARRVAVRWQHIDLLPTLLEWLGIAADPVLEGRSLLSVLDADDEPISDRGSRRPRPLFTYLHLDGPERIAVALGEWKLLLEIRHDELVWPRLYNLARDREESQDLAAEFPIRTAYLSALIRERRADQSRRLRPERVDELDGDIAEGLRALGYID